MKAAALLALVTALVAPAAAGTISITITQTARIADGNLAVDVKVGNSGDEAALSVVPILRFAGKEVRGKGTASLGPGASIEETLSMPVDALGEGRWPYRVAVDYTDQNQYPFQAVHAHSIVVGNPGPARVGMPKIRGNNIEGSGTLEVTVKNLAAEPRTATVSVFVPDGLEASDAQRTVQLEGWQEQVVTVPVVNRTALVGSRFPVFVVAEYEDGTVHQAVVAQSLMAVTGTGSFLARWRSLLLGAAAVLVAIWLALLGLRLLRPSSSAVRS